MKTPWIVVSLAFLLLVVGCKTIDEAKQDYQTGKEAALAEGEKSPSEEAQLFVDLIEAVPVVGNYAGMLAPFLVGFFTWKRGRRIRKGKLPTSTNNVTGWVGEVGIGKVKVENIVQIATDAIQGIYEVGKDGSAVKRGWKFFVTGLITLFGGALLIPAVREFVLSNTAILMGLNTVGALVAGLEKKIQEIRPVEPVAVTTTSGGDSD